MMLMPSNNRKGIAHYYAGKCPGKIGWLLSPRGWSPPPHYMPYALDNGCYKGLEPEKYLYMLGQAEFCTRQPLWVTVPDVLGDKDTTLELWHKWHKIVRGFGFKLAFVCQDGATESDVPDGVECCFIGGTDEWKLSEAHRFKGVTPLLHIGRVNTAKRLRWAENIGADSIDGTGWLRGDKRQLQAFIEFFEGSNQVVMDIG
jgi:hypothetical protein|tara:strand:- start:72 stop:674 length:603 start_codon:yes stop_codon:yes gene_type:complete